MYSYLLFCIMHACSLNVKPDILNYPNFIHNFSYTVLTYSVLYFILNKFYKVYYILLCLSK